VKLQQLIRTLSFIYRNWNLLKNSANSLQHNSEEEDSGYDSEGEHHCSLCYSEGNRSQEFLDSIRCPNCGHANCPVFERLELTEFLERTALDREIDEAFQRLAEKSVGLQGSSISESADAQEGIEESNNNNNTEKEQEAQEEYGQDSSQDHWTFKGPKTAYPP